MRKIWVLFSLVLLQWSFEVWAKGPAIRFERYSVAEGLSQGTVLDITQDHQGFLWIATYDGLNRFDGYQFKHYRHDSDNPNSLSGSSISTLFVDSQGRLWVGTDSGGLNLFNQKLGSFSHFTHDPEDPNSLSENYVAAVAEDGAGRIWVATRNQGLNLFDSKKQTFIRFKHNPDDKHSLSNDKINEMISDKRGRIWLTTQGGGLNRYDPARGGFVHYRHDKDDPTSLGHDILYGMLFDIQGKLWLGSEAGVNRFDTQTGLAIRYRHNSKDPNSLANDLVWSIAEDEQGGIWVGTDFGISKLTQADNDDNDTFTNLVHSPQDINSIGHNAILTSFRDIDNNLWFGTAGGGINKLDIAKLRFGHYKHTTSDSLSNNLVLGFYQDEANNLWVATDGGGLNRMDAKTGRFTAFTHDVNDPQSISSNRIWSIKSAGDGKLWIGTFGGGVNLFDPATGKAQRFLSVPDDPETVAGNWIYTVYIDKDDQLWVGSGDGGLSRYDQTANRFVRYSVDPLNSKSISSNSVITMLQDQDERFWVGTDNGLNLFDGKTNEFKQYLSNNKDPRSLKSGFILAIVQDSQKNLWIGAVGGGLSKYNEQTDDFDHYGMKQGLPNEIVYGIVEDSKGFLWISTNRGLSKFDPQTETFRNYDEGDGLQSNEFNTGAYYKTKQGKLVFGGLNGFNLFQPDKIIDNIKGPKVVFSEFLLFNQPVPIGQKTKYQFAIPQPIDQLEQLELGYKQSLMTFEFSALSFNSPAKNRYQYKLQGFDEQWLDSDARFRRATYTNLPAGEYNLKVRATNADGYWSKNNANLKIIVTPAPWRSWWAYSLYIIVILLSIFGYIHHRIQRNKERNELKLVAQLKQLDKQKDAFLANTSHELRTPLNGIIGLAESLLAGDAGKLPAKASKDLAMVVTSGKRLSSLVNDILDLSKLKQHSIVLNKSPVRLHHLTDIVLSLSKPMAQSKQIELINDVSEDLPTVLADKDRLLQILHNLVGNGVKFTNQGSVTVSASRQYDEIEVTITDTGIGIAKDEQQRIFKSFEQVDADDDRSHGGTGLGLSISKQLLELHESEIILESELGRGASFSFVLPVSGEKANHKVTLAESFVFEEVDESKIEVSQSLDGSQFRLLLVDDEPINLEVLNNHLTTHQYRCVEAGDGMTALELLNTHGPFDMVLLDVMMPQMSGIEVCKRIREQWTVNELPVIFLTAKNQTQDIVEGFSVGANDHIAKPVTRQELLSRVSTHLQLLDINRSLDRIVMERTEQITKTQKKLELSEKLAALGTLMAGVAHEINNPTNFVHVSVQNLEADLTKFRQFLFDLAGDDADEEILETFNQQFEPLQQHIDTIKDGTERIKVIVKDLKGATHLEESEKSLANICDIITSTMNLFSARYKNQIELTTQFQDKPEIYCYPSKLNQVVMNLLVNASDAIIEQQGKNGQGKIEVGCKIENNQVIISVRDDGPGMTEETLEHLFEPFYTTKDIDHGTGLGLSISYDIIQKHNGDIIVESWPGKGTTFNVVLPLDTEGNGSETK